MRVDLTVGAFCALLGAVATAQPAKSPLDVSAYRERLVVVGDGGKHYLVVPSDGNFEVPIFYGDGQTFYEQRSNGGGRNGEDFDRVFWDPRIVSGWQRSVERRAGAYSVQCRDRKTALTALPKDEQAQLLDKATFQPPRWKRRAHALARDNQGRYYYVDAAREEGKKDFRLFVGPRGSLKAQQMVNVVSDSAGDIFATKSGELRLVLNQSETLWVAGKAEVKLIRLPVEDNAPLIYGDLGVYEKEKLGTPCDDL